MSQQIKIIAYVVLLSFAAWFGYGFFKNLTAANAMNSGPLDTTNQLSQVTPPATNEEEAVGSTVTNQVTNAASSTNSLSAKPKTGTSAPPASRGQRTSSAMAYGGGLLVAIVCLGLLIAHDFSRFAAA